MVVHQEKIVIGLEPKVHDPYQQKQQQVVGSGAMQKPTSPTPYKDHDEIVQHEIRSSKMFSPGQQVMSG